LAEVPKNADPGHESPIELFSKLIGEGSLYDPQTFTNFGLNIIATAIGSNGLRIDLHCSECNKPSTFVLSPVTGTEYEGGVKTYPAVLAAAFKPLAPITNVNQLVEACRWLEFRCARHQHHKAFFILNIELTKIARAASGSTKELSHYSCTKIGQFPQHAELVAGRLGAISKIAERIDAIELRRAVGLMSHDVAIGAFVYLRRVFERIIADAWQRALDAGDKLPASNNLRMAEKIAALRAHLPEIVTRNAKAYGILSQGVHELSEEQCARAYPVLESSVIAMLEDIHAHAQKQQRDKALAAQLDDLAGELKDLKSPS
jgi:hypothetical protein